MNEKKLRQKHVVTRNGIRVSEKEYTTKDDALEEYQHWLNITTKWPDGSDIEIEYI